MDLLDAIGEMADKALPVNIPEVGLTISTGNELHAVREIGEQLFEVLIGDRIFATRSDCQVAGSISRQIFHWGCLRIVSTMNRVVPTGIVPLDPAVKAVNEGRLVLRPCRQ